VHGTKEDCAAAAAKLTAQFALKHATKGKPGDAPQVREASRRLQKII
jgi:hypothetical protein